METMLSRIPELGNKLEKLPELLAQYENDLKDAKDHLNLKGKTIEQANKENASWQVYYDQRKIELKTLVDFIKMHNDRIRGKLFRQYTENSQRDLSDRAKDQYINNEKAYLDNYELWLEVKELYGKYQSIVDGFTTRGFALNNITKLRCNSIENTEL